MSAVVPGTAGGTTVSINGGLYPQPQSVAVTENGANAGVVCGVTWIPIVGTSIGLDIYFLESIKYDGNDMDFLAANSASGLSNSFYYKTGVSGTKNIVVNWNSDTGILIITAVIDFMTYTNLHQTTPIAQSGVANGSTSPVTKSLVTLSADNFLVDCSCHYRSTSTSTVTPSAGQNSRRNINVGTSGARHSQMISDKAATVASQTISYTQSANRPWAEILAELAAAPSSVLQDPIIAGMVVPTPR